MFSPSLNHEISDNGLKFATSTSSMAKKGCILSPLLIRALFRAVEVTNWEELYIVVVDSKFHVQSCKQ